MPRRYRLSQCFVIKELVAVKHPKLKERKSSRHNDYYYYEAPIGSAGKLEHTGRKEENLKRAELRRRKKMKLEREEMRKIKFGRVQSNACNQFVIESKLLI